MVCKPKVSTTTLGSRAAPDCRTGQSVTEVECAQLHSYSLACFFLGVYETLHKETKIYDATSSCVQWMTIEKINTFILYRLFLLIFLKILFEMIIEIDSISK